MVTDFCCKTERFEVIGSTNTYLFDKAKSGDLSTHAVIAERQTAGRGRRGKSFFSDGGKGLYLSVLVCEAVPLDKLHLLTPAAACVVSRAIEEVSGKTCGIKWVNDVYIGAKKVSGILTETKCNFEKGVLEFAVVGIGVNLAAPLGGYPDGIKEIAGAVFDDVDNDLKNTLADKIISGIMNLDKMIKNGEFLCEYRSRSILDGREIEIIVPEGTVFAKAVGIDKEARLEVEIGGERKKISSGDVSIRLKKEG